MNLRMSTLILMLVSFASGCNSTDAPRKDLYTPVHTSVVCGERAANRAEAVAAFDAWISDHQALYRAGSTFSVWLAGNTRTAYSCRSVVRIPTSWGANVLGTKARFVQTARGLIEDGFISGTTARWPEDAAPPGVSDPGTHRVYLLSKDGMVPLEAWRPIAGPAAEALHTAVICDRSSSARDHYSSGDLASAFDAWIVEGHAVSGATFTVYQMGRSYDTTVKVYEATVPPFFAGQKAAFLLGARKELEQVLPHKTGENASAVAEAIALAARELREKPGRYQLLLFSDLRQYTPGVLNFEEIIPTAEEFIPWLKTEGLLADLKNIPVTVCGVHNQSGPGTASFNAKRAAQLRKTWEATFHSMGVAGVRIYSTTQLMLASR